MVCEKCGSKTTQNNKCLNCGYDNSEVRATQKYKSNSAIYRSTRLTVFLYLLIALNIITILFVVWSVFAGEPSEAVIITSVISIISAVFELVLSVFMLKLKKWALNAYIITNIIVGVIRIFAGGIIIVIMKALFLYFIFRNDWDYFE